MAILCRGEREEPLVAPVAEAVEENITEAVVDSGPEDSAAPPDLLAGEVVA